MLTELAQAKYPDGATPEVDEVVKLATFLFAAGKETTTKLLSAGDAGDRRAARHPGQALRDDRELIPAFLEESPADGKPGEEPFPAGADHHPVR